MTANPIIDSYRHDQEVAGWEDSLPICDQCGRPITDEKFHIINGEKWCDECLDECEVFTDNYVWEGEE